MEFIKASLDEAAAALSRLRDDEAMLQRIRHSADTLIACLENSGTIYSCGNGGSLCDAMHFAEELSGRFRRDRPGLRATAISDPAHLTCAGNDFGYDHIFSRYVEAHARPGDVLLAISTSGKSANVIEAAKAAKAGGMRVVSLTGTPNSALSQLADHDLCTPGGQFSDRVQELHIKIIHILIESIERHFFPENYR